MELLALLGQQPKEYIIAWMNIIGQANIYYDQFIYTKVIWNTLNIYLTCSQGI